MQWSRFSFVNEDFALHAVLGMARSRVFSMPSSSEGGGDVSPTSRSARVQRQGYPVARHHQGASSPSTDYAQLASGIPLVSKTKSPE